jgi:uncharacterized protein DUF6498
MAEKTDIIDLTGLLRPHYLLHPSTVLLIASDLFPLAGIAFWHWDTFLLLMLYWMDTAVIAFWTIARIATTSRDGLNDLRITRAASPPTRPGPCRRSSSCTAGCSWPCNSCSCG